MKLELPYGDRTLEATLPDRTRLLSNVEVATLPPVEDPGATVRQALEVPLGLPRIGELVTPGASVTIAFDDATVPSYGPIRGVAIKAVLEELEAAGVSRRNVTLLCANALHRMNRPAELARLIGEDLVAEFGSRLLCHDAEDPQQIVDLGQTAEHGYAVEVHRLVAESDLAVYVNSRYNRGFSGGWKSVCVGLSTYTSIRLTHTPTACRWPSTTTGCTPCSTRWAPISSGASASASSSWIPCSPRIPFGSPRWWPAEWTRRGRTCWRRWPGCSRHGGS